VTRIECLNRMSLVSTRALMLYFFVILISGCGTPDPNLRYRLLEHNGGMPYWKGNNGAGILNAGVDVPAEQRIKRMESRCGQMSRRLDSSSIRLVKCYDDKILCEYSYYCTADPLPNLTVPTNNYSVGPMEFKPAAPAQDEPAKASLEDAKNKCVELGFRISTEKFGECVLRLSK
jgi:hypothetical protein